jgi:FlaA1/EpsC-like NDP-sugar epimerase
MSSNITAFTGMYQTIKGIIVKNRRLVVIFIHLIQAVLANYLAFILRLEDILLNAQYYKYLYIFLAYLPILLIIRLLFYLQSGLYKDLWRYSSVSDLIKIVKSTTFGSIIFYIVVRYIFGDLSYPRSIYILDWGFLIMISGGSRLLIRIFREYMESQTSGKRTLIIGAGNAGEMIVRDMKHNPKFAYDPIGFIDDNRYKKGLSIHGVPIFGPRSMLGQVIEEHKPEEILISLPSAILEITE